MGNACCRKKVRVSGPAEYVRGYSQLTAVVENLPPPPPGARAPDLAVDLCEADAPGAAAGGGAGARAAGAAAPAAAAPLARADEFVERQRLPAARGARESVAFAGHECRPGRHYAFVLRELRWVCCGCLARHRELARSAPPFACVDPAARIRDEVQRAMREEHERARSAAEARRAAEARWDAEARAAAAAAAAAAFAAAAPAKAQARGRGASPRRAAAASTAAPPAAARSPASRPARAGSRPPRSASRGASKRA